MYESILSLVALVSAYLAPGFENLPQKFETALPQPSQVYAANGDLMFEFGMNPEAQVQYEALGEPLVQAIVAAEDKTFFKHNGFQFKALARASVYSLQSIIGSEATRLQGGSTITQQLAKVLYTDRKANFRRKAVEAYVARKLEADFTKQEILTRYANEIYLGNGVVGVSNAARHYFDKEPSELSVNEAATIAAMIRAPESMLRNEERHRKTRGQILASLGIEVSDDLGLGLQSNVVPKRKISRAFGYYEDQVVKDLQDLFGKERMLQGGFKVQTAYVEEMQMASSYAISEALTLANATMRKGKVKVFKANGPLPSFNQFGLSADIQKVDAGWQANFIDFDENGEEVEGTCLIPNTVELGRHKVKLAPYLTSATSIRIMPISPEIDTKALAAIPASKESLIQKFCLPIVQSTLGAGATILDPKTGGIKAIVGGVDYHATKFNRASQAYRQTGSLLKPFVFLQGVEKGFRLNKKLSMKAKSYDLGKGKFWQPRNSGKSNQSQISLESALLRSKNIPTVNLTDEIGFTRVYHRLKSLNVGPKVPRELTAVLGAGSASIRDMAGDYALFANEQGSVPPLTVSKVEDLNNRTVFNLALQTCTMCRKKSSFTKYLARKEKQKAYDVAAIRSIRGVLERVTTSGTASRIGQPFDYKIFGKTGTTNEVRDAWFVGGTIGRDEGELIVGTYLGYDSPKRIANYGSGGSLAAPLFKAILSNLDGYKVKPVLVASNTTSASSSQRRFNARNAPSSFGYLDLSTVSPSYTYSATASGNVNMRKHPRASGKYIKLIKKGGHISSVTCLKYWCKGTHDGRTGWFVKRRTNLKPNKMIGGTLAFSYKHPITVIAANFSTAVKTEAELAAKTTTEKVVTKRTPTAQKKKRRRCKMQNIDGAQIEVCYNF